MSVQFCLRACLATGASNMGKTRSIKKSAYLSSSSHLFFLSLACFYDCVSLTSLSCLPPALTSIDQEAFCLCFNLLDVGPGFSPDCAVHPDAFSRCSSLHAAARANGFSTPTEWGKHRWLVVGRRTAVLLAVLQLRERELALLPSEVLARLAVLPDWLVREVVKFVGAGLE